MKDENCIFCKIADGKIPTEKIFENDKVVAFRDIDPQAPTHVLVIPREHFASSSQVEDDSIFGDLVGSAVKIAKDLGLDESGYRMVINTGKQGGQSVPHLHLHLLAGRNLGWPPG